MFVVEPGLYEYSVEKDEYIVAFGEVEVIDDDVVVNITLIGVGIDKLNVNSGFAVSQNFPNPVKGYTQFSINLEQRSMVEMEIVNIMGQRVYTNNLGDLNDGSHPVSIDMTGFASGIYFCTVKANDLQKTIKVVVE